MSRKLTAIVAILVGLGLGYALRWVEVAQSDRKNYKKSINYVTSSESSEFFDALNRLGITRESLKMTFSGPSLQIVVEVPDASVDATVDALKSVAPAYPVSLEVRSERGPVIFLPNGVVDFRGVLDQLNQTDTSKSEQEHGERRLTRPESKDEP